MASLLRPLNMFDRFTLAVVLLAMLGNLALTNYALAGTQAALALVYWASEYWRYQYNHLRDAVSK